MTKSGYKFIDVGIAAILPTYVDIVIGNYHGNKEISLSLDTWKEFVDQKHVVLSRLFANKNEETQAHASSTINIGNGNLQIRFGKTNNVSVLRLQTSATRLVIAANTVLYMFKLEHCINRIAATLRAITDNVDAKLTRFLAIASTNPANAPTAIRDSEFFDCNDIVDCELAALCFGTMVE